MIAVVLELMVVLMLMVVPVVVPWHLDGLRWLKPPKVPVPTGVRVFVHMSSVAMQRRCTRTTHAAGLGTRSAK